MTSILYYEMMLANATNRSDPSRLSYFYNILAAVSPGTVCNRMILKLPLLILYNRRPTSDFESVFIMALTR